MAVILARGGSKEIPLKNIMKVSGRPLISYTIGASIMAGLETWVSTDNKDIAYIAKDYGAKVLIRPDEISKDTSKSEDALLHFADNILFDNLVFIQPTSPLLKSHHIEDGLKMLDSYDSVFSGYKQHWIPEWIMDKSFQSEFTPYKWDIFNRYRRQDTGFKYIENGAFYITSRDNLITSKCRYSGNIGCYEMNYSDSFQLDSWDDLKIIEALLERYR